MGLLIGFCELKNPGVSNAYVEGDSKVVIRWGLDKSNGYWKYANQIHEIWDLMVCPNISRGSKML